MLFTVIGWGGYNEGGMPTGIETGRLSTDGNTHPLSYNEGGMPTGIETRPPFLEAEKVARYNEGGMPTGIETIRLALLPV